MYLYIFHTFALSSVSESCSARKQSTIQNSAQTGVIHLACSDVIMLSLVLWCWRVSSACILQKTFHHHHPFHQPICAPSKTCPAACMRSLWGPFLSLNFLSSSLLLLCSCSITGLIHLLLFMRITWQSWSLLCERNPNLLAYRLLSYKGSKKELLRFRKTAQGWKKNAKQGPHAEQRADKTLVANLDIPILFASFQQSQAFFQKKRKPLGDVILKLLTRLNGHVFLQNKAHPLHLPLLAKHYSLQTLAGSTADQASLVFSGITKSASEKWLEQVQCVGFPVSWHTWSSRHSTALVSSTAPCLLPKEVPLILLVMSWPSARFQFFPFS